LPDLSLKIDPHLERLKGEFYELKERLEDPDLLKDPPRLAQLSQRFHELKGIVELYEAHLDLRKKIEEIEEWIQKEGDPELKRMGEEEIVLLEKQGEEIEGKIYRALLPSDPEDSHNAILEIRAGTGGEEAALFAADIYRMYVRYADRKGWKVEEIERHTTGLKGIKEVIAVVEGKGSYARLKYESGVHRVQRIPITESQGRIHTSACTVAVLPEMEEVEVEIDPKDLKIEVFRASGPGGQHVNTTDSAVRITHIPTGIVVTSQDERSQHKNKAKAMRVLRARLYDHIKSQKEKERRDLRRSLIKSGDRSDRIRTYNFPQNRVTDHRIQLTLYRLEEILDGDLDELIDALARQEELKRLEGLLEEA
jgi:peptide chain release factor 1